MKEKSSILKLVLPSLFICGIIFLTSCKEEPVLPTLTTTDASDIAVSTAMTGGNVTSDGGAEVTARGVCWGTTSGPLISGPHTSDGNGEGVFNSNLTGLASGTLYYVRAYAVNEAGTSYGNEISFTTIAPTIPILTTREVTLIASTSSVSGGNITSDGNSAITAKGVCWGTTIDPTIVNNNNKTSDGTGKDNYASDITGLQPGTTYHVRAYATNALGTGYGNDIEFKTLSVPPTVTTAGISSKTYTSAVSGGNVTNTGGADVTARGVCWSTSPGPVASGSHTTDGAGAGSFISNITGLNPNTTYFFRAYATNSAGTSYGVESNFTTNPATAPSLTTNPVSGVTLTQAVSGGNITSENGAPVTARGVCWNTTGNPTTSDPNLTSGTGIGSFSITITGLTQGNVYYTRAFATNSAGTSYGNQVVFPTSIADIESNVYKTVLIGSQVWMAENLKTTLYRDGSSIPNVTGSISWNALTTDAYCWYNNNEASYKALYGALYNWFSVNKGTLCPTGWHVPTDGEFKTLEISLGMTLAQADEYSVIARGTDQGARIKSTTGWESNGNGTNSSGFNGLPGGYRYGADGGFYDIGKLSYWWTATEFEYDALKGTYRRVDYYHSFIFREGTSKKGGKYVRCVKN